MFLCSRLPRQQEARIKSVQEDDTAIDVAQTAIASADCYQARASGGGVRNTPLGPATVRRFLM
jgi:hypothetical protein